MMCFRFTVLYMHISLAVPNLVSYFCYCLKIFLLLFQASINVLYQTIYFLTNLSTADEPCVIDSIDHKLIHHQSYSKAELWQISLFI